MSTMTHDRRSAQHGSAQHGSAQSYQFLFDRGAMPARRPRQATPATSRVRLTRRGRVLILVSALVIAFAIGIFVSAAGSVATEHPGTPAPTRIIQVHDGDTLWQIASRLADGGDVRSMMTTIQRLNALDTSDVYAGQRLVIPAG